MAYDHSYSKDNLSKYFLNSEIAKFPAAQRNQQRETISNKAYQDVQRHLRNVNLLRKVTINNKSAYTINLLEHNLIVRKLHQNLRKSFYYSAPNRHTIIKNLLSLLREATPYNVYRLDIQSFFESVDKNTLFEHLDNNYFLCAYSKKILKELFKQFESLGGSGIPRGLSISNILSDIYMQSFDQAISKNNVVFYYRRYVDDIIIITSCKEDKDSFLTHLSSELPKGLIFNSDDKFQFISISKNINNNSLPLNYRFDYLGYSFSIENNHSKDKNRAIKIDIANNKIKKIKTKIIRAFIAFSKDQNFEILIERLLFLSTNFSIYDRNKGRKKLSGIYYNYPELSENNESLLELDQYLRTLILSKATFKHLNISSKLSKNQKRKLLSLSFFKSHTNRSFNYFSGQRIKVLKECWKNV